jgi:uncharacterized protein YecT (DUF1311 family)
MEVLALVLALAATEGEITEAERQALCLSSHSDDLEKCLSLDLEDAENEFRRYLDGALRVHALPLEPCPEGWSPADCRAHDERLLRKAQFSIDALEEAQHRWREYVEADCEAVYRHWADATLREVRYLSCKIERVKQRTHDLWSIYLRDRDISDLPEPGAGEAAEPEEEAAAGVEPGAAIEDPYAAQGVDCSDPAAAPRSAWYRLRADLDFDGRQDLLLSVPASTFGSGGGSFFVYLARAGGGYVSAGELGLHPTAIHVEKKRVGEGLVHGYWHGAAGSGTLRTWLVGRDGVRQVSNRRLNLGNEAADQEYQRLFGPRGRAPIERSRCVMSGDGMQLEWKPYGMR